MAAAAGEKESVSLSHFMEVNNLEVEEELSTMDTLAWAEEKKCRRCNKEEGTEKHRLYHCPCWKEIQIPKKSRK